MVDVFHQRKINKKWFQIFFPDCCRFELKLKCWTMQKHINFQTYTCILHILSRVQTARANASISWNCHHIDTIRQCIPYRKSNFAQTQLRFALFFIPMSVFSSLFVSIFIYCVFVIFDFRHKSALSEFIGIFHHWPFKHSHGYWVLVA